MIKNIEEMYDFKYIMLEDLLIVNNSFDIEEINSLNLLSISKLENKKQYYLINNLIEVTHKGICESLSKKNVIIYVYKNTELVGRYMLYEGDLYGELDKEFLLGGININSEITIRREDDGIFFKFNHDHKENISI